MTSAHVLEVGVLTVDCDFVFGGVACEDDIAELVVICEFVDEFVNGVVLIVV